MSTVRYQFTPNPNAIKFSVPGVRLLSAGLLVFGHAAEAAAHPLGAALFAVEGVANVFVVPDFLTVTKTPTADWDALLPALQSAVAACLADGLLGVD